MENKNFSFYANMSSQEIFTELQTSASGLSAQEAERRYALYGPNATTASTVTWFTIFKNQISNPFVVMFLIVAAIYFFTNQITESIVLITIMVINTCIGFYQEYHSNQAMALLQSYVQATTTVNRAGVDTVIAISQIVPGDIIVLKAGDIVPADCRIIESENLIVDEASLTGESLPIKKSHEVQQQKITELYNATTCCFAGTVVVDGAGTAVVFATGAHTELGFIALLATRTITKSNLTKGTMQLAQTVLLVVLISLVIVVFINVFVKTEKASLLNILFFAAALAISAIPSALPIVITFCLTKGAMALRKHKMIVKRLSAIEDLGGIEVFCTDKTGTLTENSLSVNDVYAVRDHDTLLYAALTSRRAAHTVTSHSFDDAIAQKLTPEQTAARKDYTIIKELPFTYERHRSITLARKGDAYTLITKGSAEYIITKCPSLTESEITSLNQWIKESEMRGNRVLAVATKIITGPAAHLKSSSSARSDASTLLSSEHPPALRSLGEGRVEEYPRALEDTTYDVISLISFADPLKPTAHDAIKKAQALGVQIKVFSGDSPYVCFTIAQQLGLETDINNVVHGTDFENSTEEQKMFLVNNRTIFARVTPEQKYQMIAYLQRTYSVGYMGDGINDAPALKIANVGIVVNDAAPVAREAAEIIMLQKSLLNIVLGIEEGRKIIINTLKYIKITISSNVGNFYALAFSSLLINYLPMLPLQLVFLDLITDFPLIAISTDAVNHQELGKPLQYSMKEVGFVTLIFGMVCLPFYGIMMMLFKGNAATLQTSWFVMAALMQLVLTFSLRAKIPFWRAQWPSLSLAGLCLVSVLVVTIFPFTEFGQKLFLFERPTLHNLFIICCIILAYFITTETVKILYYRFRNKVIEKV